MLNLHTNAGIPPNPARSTGDAHLNVIMSGRESEPSTAAILFPNHQSASDAVTLTQRKAQAERSPCTCDRPGELKALLPESRAQLGKLMFGIDDGIDLLCTDKGLRRIGLF